MSRVHCPECGTAVVLDPRGVCPEGHHVGAQGARVEQAMGHELAHPDEPEPWVYVIERDTLPVPVGAGAKGTGSAGAGSNGTGPREARPVRLTSFDEDEGGNDPESLLRELHSLAAFDAQPDAGRANGHQASPNGHQASPNGHQASPNGHSSPTNGHSSPTDGSHPPADAEAGGTMPPPPDTGGAGSGPPPPPTTTSRPRPARPDPDAMAEAFAELSALDAPAQAMTSRSGPTGSTSRPQVPSSRDGGHGRGNADADMDDDELASLFNSPPPADDPAPAPPRRDLPGDAPPPPGGARAVSDAPPGQGSPPAPDPHDRPAPSFEVDATELDFDLDLADGAGIGGAGGNTAGARAVPHGTDADDPGIAAGGHGDDVAAQLSALSSVSELFGGTAEEGATPPVPGGGPAPNTDEPGADEPGAAPTPYGDPGAATGPQAAPRDDGGAGTGATGTPARPPAPDLTSFTAKGGSASRTGKRRRFGR